MSLFNSVAPGKTVSQCEINDDRKSCIVRFTDGWELGIEIHPLTGELIVICFPSDKLLTERNAEAHVTRLDADPFI